MKVKTLDTVVLRSDLPESGLAAGDVGAIVEVFGNEAVEVEFVTPSGKTRALVTLKLEEIRPIGPDDILSVRNQNAA